MAGVIALCTGFLADLGLGDPRWLYHPVCAIGKWIAFLEKKLRRWFPKTAAGEQAAGMALVVLVLLPAARFPWQFCHFCTGGVFGLAWGWRLFGVIRCWRRSL